MRVTGATSHESKPKPKCGPGERLGKWKYCGTEAGEVLEKCSGQCGAQGVEVWCRRVVAR